MSQPELSVVINTKNAATTLRQALASVQPIADEIIVVDMFSQDETLKIAREYTDRIFHFERDTQYVEPARNFALSKATGHWILILDADEELTEGLAKKIKHIVTGHISRELQADCYFIPRQNIIFGKSIERTGWWPDYQLRLFKSGYVTWSDQIHAVPQTQGSIVYLPADKDLSLIHHNYASISEFINRLNRYTDIQSTATQHQAEAVSPQAVLSTFKNEFLSRYFAQAGSEEGLHGLSLSLLQTFSEVVKVLKIWEQSGFQLHSTDHQTLKEFQSLQQSLNYWLADYHYKHSSGFQRWYWQLRRKLKI